MAPFRNPAARSEGRSDARDTFGRQGVISVEMKRPICNAWCAIVALVSAIALTGGCAPEQPTDPRPSILLVVVDTLRADAVSAYGAVEDTTPSFDALASGGLLYERAYALGLKKKFPSLKRIRVYFKLPHQSKLDFHEFDVDEAHGFQALYLRIKTVVARAVEQTFAQQDATFAAAKPNVPTCIFCARLGLCDKVASEMLKVCHKFAPLKVPEDITPSKLRGPQDAAVAMRCAQVAKVWADSLRQVVSNAVISGSMAMPPGYKIESREGNRKVVFCLRGMKTNMGDPHRNFVDFAHVPAVKRLTRMPVGIDPSHSVGTRAAAPDGLLDIFHVVAQGIVAGANMVLVDFHPDPAKALVDGPQALLMSELPYFLDDVALVRETYAKRADLAARFHAAA